MTSAALLAPQRLVAAVGAWTLLALIFTSNLIPIGTIFGVPFRTSLYMVVLATTLWLMVFTHGPSVRGTAAFGASLLGVISLAALNGMLSGQIPDNYVLDDLRTYVVTFSIPILALLNVELNVISARSVARAFVWGTLVYATTKVIFFWIMVLIPQIALILIVFFLNGSSASVVFGFVAPGISRIQTGLDFSATISLVFVMIDRRHVILGQGRSAAVAILSFAVLVTFSRTLVALLILVLSAYLTFAAPRRTRIIGGTLLAVVLAMIVVLGADALRNRLETGQKGDQTRKPQAEALLDLWEEAPLFGNGIGAFNHILSRDSEAPYNYELQLHSIASKLGLAGIAFLLCLAIVAFSATAAVMPSGIIGWPIGMFLAFLAAASTNPYMFSSAAANVYVALFIGFRAFETSVKAPSAIVLRQAT